MIRRLTVLVAATMLALILAAPAALAGGATQISGVGVFDDPEVPTCNDDLGGEDADYDYALVMTGDLKGCLYTFVDPDPAVSPSGTYRETGTELFVGSWGAETGTFRTTYRFEAKYEDVDNLAGEIFGRCQHPIVEGSGTDVFEGVSGQLFFKDDVETGEFFYRGHLRY
jgi:hypothetical protein